MQNKDTEKTADNLIMAIIFNLYIGWGLLFLVKFGINHLTNDAYMGLIPATLIVLPFFWMAADLARIFPGLSISVIFSRVFGRVFGKALAVIFWLYIVFYNLICLRFAQLMVFSYFFKRTPFYVINAVLIASIAYLALKGIKPVSRLAGFILLPPVTVIFLLEILGLGNVNLLNVRPVIPASFWQWMNSGLDLTFIILPGTAIFLFMHQMKQTRNIVKISLTALAGVIPVFFLALFGTVGVFGPSQTIKMSWSTVEFFHIIDYPYLLLEQAGLFFLIAWYALFYISMVQGLYNIGDNYHIIFPKIPRNLLILGLAGLDFAVIQLPINIVYLESFLLKFQRWVGFSYLGILLGTWLAARLRARARGFRNREK